MKHCTNCGAQIADGAKFCGECGQAVAPPSSSTAAPPSPPKDSKPEVNAGYVAKGCGCLLAIVITLAVIGSCVRKSEPEAAQTPSAQTAEDERKGFHCLSGWDGSNRSLVDQIKHNLRDPDSFEHDETKITPEKGGKHMVMMRYRARNGFGGMNVSTAIAEVDHTTCEATIISTGEG